MKVQSVKTITSNRPRTVVDCYVNKGYLQGPGGSLPDVDIDYESTRRQDIKEYIERRYNHNGKQRVFSAGTMTTLKMKAVIKDVARTMRIPVQLVNYFTAIIEDDACDYTGIFKLGFENKRIAKFIHDYPQLFENIRTLMFQPRSSSIHASALLVTPDQKDGEEMECFDFTPIKKVDGLLVSEFDGYQLDESGLLKNDCLATKELSKLHSTMDLCNSVYGTHLTLEEIATGNLDDAKVYELLSNGYTQNVFQFASKGMTKFLMDMKPNCIDDLIAANALYRPATLENGSTELYVDCKRGYSTPVYLWGTYNALHNTYGTLCLAEGTMVRTIDGQKRIEDVNEGELVQTHDGSYQHVKANYYKGRKETIIIRTSHGEELRCTPDHKVLTQYGWVQAQHLIPNKHCIKGFWYSEKTIEQGTIQDWCVGLYLANGNWATTPTIACRNREDADKISAIFNNAFDLQCYVYYNVRCWYVRTTYRLNNNKPNPFKEYLKKLGLEGKKSYDKVVPSMSLMMLTGFIEGDGCLNNGRIRIKNKRLSHLLFETLQALHIPSSIYSTIESSDVVWNVAFLDDTPLLLQIHTHKKHVRHNGAKIPSIYLSNINLDSLNKQERSNTKMAIEKDTWCFLSKALALGAKVDHEVWGVVLSVSTSEPCITYDLSVEHNHSFVSGGLVTHNCYQEQVAQIAREVGGFSLGEGVKLVKFISKKKTEKIQAMKGKFMEGAAKNNCPKEEATAIWDQIEACGSYLFNRSHATAYAITSYVGAYLKANYPTAFYTVALEWANDDELPIIITEMESCSNAKIVAPDINKSGEKFYTDFETDSIFWSLNRIKQVGVKAVDWIVEERSKRGDFSGIDDFIDRVFRYKLKKYKYFDDPDNEEETKRCPVNARHVLHLVLAGCFDKSENVKANVERYDIIKKAAAKLGFELKAKDFPEDLVDKHYFWSCKQLEVAGIGSIDYRRIYDNSQIKPQLKGRVSYVSLKDLALDSFDGKRAGICATIVEIEEKKYVSKKTGETETYCKLLLQQNNDVCEAVCWAEEYARLRGQLINSKNKLIVCSGVIKYSDYAKSNNFQFTKSSIIDII